MRRDAGLTSSRPTAAPLVRDHHEMPEL